MDTVTLNDIVLTEKDFKQISQIVYDHCGINLHAGKKELVRARLAKRLRAGNFKTFPEYMEYVLSDKTGMEFSILIDSISTNLTSFFREDQHFKYMENVFLPAMFERKKAQRNFKIRAWSAGCSSGEEPYTIAIVLNEALRGQGRWDTKILATDISTNILAMARKGMYSEERVAPVPAAQKQKYLVCHTTKGEKVYEVSHTLKDMIVFSYLNLMKDWPIKGPIDFIFCRNVMIYFDKPTQSVLINRYWDLLDSGGVLFTGHSESLTGIEHKFKYVQPTIYMKP
ncbi:MAG: protein-glutamate O-methyltransferase [Planctomycetaceae bacterium]|jgi:chemotaxis protein methyltransferase CheR|nr:protein-glutamate O-methyltransferase [Planctomycetaceae bacterium]